MQVLHIQKIAGIAGSENHLLTLLPRLMEHGYMPTMLALTGRGNGHTAFVQSMRDAKIPTAVLPIRSDLDPLLIPRLIRFIRQGAYEVVHTHLLHADLYGTLAARLAGVRRVLCTNHNDDAFRQRYPLRWLNAWSMRQRDHAICISEHVRRFCATVEGVPMAKMTVVHYGLNSQEKQRDRAWRRQFGWDAEVPVLGIVARLTAQKGHLTLLHAMPEVVRQFPTTRLAVIGDGELRQTLQDATRRLGLAPHVHFLGYRDHAAALMGGFDVFVHPSRWEGFGLVFLEAMAAGLPVVATQVSAIPEIVQHGQTGLLVPKDDAPALAQAICTLLANRAMAHTMGQAGRRRLEQCFTVTTMVQRTCDVYARLLQAP